VNPTTSSGGSVNIAGDLVLGATNPRIYFPNIGVAPPSFTNRSSGTKLVIFPSVGAGQVDYAIGIDSNTIWYSTNNNSSSFFHKWYGGTTNIMTLDGIGNLSIFGTTDSSSSSTGVLQISGGVGIAKSLYVGLNAYANNHINGYATTATAAGTTVLTVSSAQQQYFTGSTTQTVILPVTSTLSLGMSFTIVNNSSGVVTVQSSGANSIKAMAADSTLILTCILLSGTTAASWNSSYTTDTGLPDLTSPGPIGNTTASSGAFTTLSSSSTTTITSTTDSSSTSTGSLIISGGVGIAKKLWTGSDIVSGSNFYGSQSGFNLYLLNTNKGLFIDSTGNVTGNVTTDSSSVSTGALQVSGGVGITKSLNASNLFVNSAISGGPLIASGFGVNINAKTYTDSVTAASGTQNFNWANYIFAPTLAASNTSVTTTNTATLLIQGAPIPGTNMTITNSYALWIAAGNVTIQTTNDSSSSTTGSLQVSGGVGIAKSLQVGTFVTASTFVSTVSTGTSPFTVASSTVVANLNASTLNGATFASPGAIGSTTPATTITSSGIVTLSNATVSTSNSTGSLVLSAGGLGIQNTTDATSSTNGGSLTTSGGVGIGKSLKIGTTLSVNGGLTNAGLVKYYQSSNTGITTGCVFILNITSNSGYHAKVRAMLNESSNSQNSSIITFEAQGKSTSSSFVWNTTVSSQSNAFPWSSTVTGNNSGSTSHTLTFQANNASRTYDYYIFVELFTSSAVLASITLDGSTATTFTY
jgi:hypothetical protein